jgi:hypothetical protein
MHSGLDEKSLVIVMGTMRTIALECGRSYIDGHSGNHRGRHETHHAGDRDRKTSRRDDHH